MKPRVILLALGLAASAWLALSATRGQDGESASVVEAVQRPQAQEGSRVVAAGRAVPISRGTAMAQASGATQILRLRDRPPFVRRTELTLREPRIFNAGSWDPPPPKPVAAVAVPVATAPPLPYTYVGRKLQDGAWEVYLAMGEEMRVARAHATLDAKYRIDTISPPVLSLTYLPLNQKQTLNIGSTE